MSCLLTDQDRAPVARWFATAIVTTKVEVELYHMQLCHALSPFRRQMDTRWVVDMMTKLVHFIPIHTTFHVSTLAKTLQRSNCQTP